MDRKERNGTLKAEWEKDLPARKWEIERNNAKCDRRMKARWTKPKITAMEKLILKPKVANFEEECEEG